jgi:SAM-dependent methyltransferase
MTEAWNHNIHYHDVVLRAVPAGCRRALDVGCGTGMLTRELAQRCDEVVALDLDGRALERARGECNATGHVTLVEGDVMTHPFADGSFDLITAVATLHHLPLRPALTRFRNLLRGGGVLAIVGLYRHQTLADFAFAVCAEMPANWILGALNRHRFEEVQAPLQEPGESLREIRNAFDGVTPGGTLRRHLLFRYSFIWRKP